MNICNIAIKVRQADNSFYTMPTLVGPGGLSAYQIAVNAGFVGTEQDWLNSLKGLPGAPGAQGPPGPQGFPGNTYQFIFKLTADNIPPEQPENNQTGAIPTGWSATALSISPTSPYLWVTSRIRTNNIWQSFAVPSLLSVYTSGGGSSYTLPVATETTLGGIKAPTRTTEITPVVIDPSTGYLYTSATGGGTGGGIEDVPLDPTNPKLYARYSGDQSWREVLPEQGSVGTLQQVTTNGPDTTNTILLQGGAKISNLLQVPKTAPMPGHIDSGHFAFYVGEGEWESQVPTPGSSYTLPIASATVLGGIKVGDNLSIDPSTGILSAIGGTGGGGVTIHNQLTQRSVLDCHPMAAISGLEYTINNLLSSLSNLQDALASKLDSAHSSDPNAHASLFSTKANKNGDASENFAVNNLTATNNVTMKENINTNLRVPKSAPTNPVPGEWYFYID